MPHQQQQADPDVAQVLVSGITGIHPDSIEGYVLIVANDECGGHLTTSACCVYHALADVMAYASSELQTAIPCSDGAG